MLFRSYQKHVLVVLSDGGDNASRHSEQEMLDRAAMSNALVYTVVDPDVFTPGEGDKGVLKRLAKLSGGVAYFPKSSKELVKDFEEIAGNIRRGYSIGYVPTWTHVHNQTHRVKVLVRAPGLRMRQKGLEQNDQNTEQERRLDRRHDLECPTQKAREANEQSVVDRAVRRDNKGKRNSKIGPSIKEDEWETIEEHGSQCAEPGNERQ